MDTFSTLGGAIRCSQDRDPAECATFLAETTYTAPRSAGISRSMFATLVSERAFYRVTRLYRIRLKLRLSAVREGKALLDLCMTEAPNIRGPSVIVSAIASGIVSGIALGSDPPAVTKGLHVRGFRGC